MAEWVIAFSLKPIKYGVPMAGCYTQCSNVQMFKIINDEEVSLQCLESLNIFYFH